MALAPLPARQVYLGSPVSPTHKPDPMEIVRLWDDIQAKFAGVVASGGLVYGTLAQINADLAHDANAGAQVVNDPVAANNGVYRKIGASGAGSWTRVADLPYNFIPCTDAGAGTANDVILTSYAPAPSVPRSVMFIAKAFEANSGAMTIALNGAAAKPVVTVSGNPLSAGFITTGMVYGFFDDGTQYQLASDVAAASVLAAAEAAALAAQEAAQDVIDSITVLTVANVAALKAIDTSRGVTVHLGYRAFEWVAGDFSARITAVDPRFIASNANPSGSLGAWIHIGSVPTGFIDSLDGARIHRLNDRLFGGTFAAYGGEWASPDLQTGLDPLMKYVNGWIARETSLMWGSIDGSMAITGFSQSSHQLGGDGLAEWPLLPGAVAAIGVTGATINDRMDTPTPGWGLYGEAWRFNSGFTVAQELAIANIGAEGATMNPFNVITGGADAGVGAWIQAGNGADVYWPEYEKVKSSSAGITLLSSYRPAGGRVQWENGRDYVVGRVANQVYADDATAYVCLVDHTAPPTGTFAAYRTANPLHWALRKDGDWVTATNYNVGDLATDPTSRCTFRVLVAHTASGGVFSTYRQSNPSHFKQLPAFKMGLTIAAGSLEEAAAGTNLFSGIKMPERTQVEWGRMNGASYESSAVLQCENIPAGSPIVGLLFQQNLLSVLATNGLRADAVRIGGNTNFATFSRGTNANDDLIISNPGTGVGAIVIGGSTMAYLRTDSIDLLAGKVLKVANTQVVKGRIGGWAMPTGTATRTTFATSTVTLPQLAERVFALIQDLHATAGHGLLGN